MLRPLAAAPRPGALLNRLAGGAWDQIWKSCIIHLNALNLHNVAMHIPGGLLMSVIVNYLLLGNIIITIILIIITIIIITITIVIATIIIITTIIIAQLLFYHHYYINT